MTHPITPPPELVQEWFESAAKDGSDWPCKVAVAAAEWGADQELEACCQFFQSDLLSEGRTAERLRAARRPKQPSLKEQALELARPAEAEGAYVTFGPDELATIRRALEQLSND